uniref:C-type lectin domain-containing protein n=1 Tax=Echeneis naucrates TaxID=173247 RepID=A0A665T8F3_ECHNA
MTEMAEEINYASVVFKAKKNAQPEANEEEEEIVYDEVKVPNQTSEQSGHTKYGFIPEKSHSFQVVACCLVILCVILTIGIITVCVYHSTVKNLTEENQKLLEQNQNMEINWNNITQDNQKLLEQNQNLEKEKNSLTQQIQKMETEWNKLNVSRAQWSIDAYCPKKDRRGECKACQDGWQQNRNSCYAIVHQYYVNNWKNWTEAQNDCKGKASDLVVVGDDTEKEYVCQKSWYNKGYWIGLRVEDGKWKWIDGSDLKYDFWIKSPEEGHCAVSYYSGWRSVSCSETNQWICEKEALSV